MVDITVHKAGYSLVNKLYELQHEAPRNSFWHKLFAVSPIAPESRSWYTGLVGELKAGRILDTLVTEGYIVLHSVPIGTKGSDIDHVVISPSGIVYTINTKHHEGKKIWVADKTLMINGQKEPHLRNSLYEAKRVAAKLPGTVKVQALLIFVNPQSITEKKTSAVPLLTLDSVKRYLRSQEEGHEKAPSNPALALLADSSFWTSSYVDETVHQDERFAWYAQLKQTMMFRSFRRKLGGLIMLGGLLGFGYLGIMSLLEILSTV